jgi:hypothetical protein
MIVLVYTVYHRHIPVVYDLSMSILTIITISEKTKKRNDLHFTTFKSLGSMLHNITR